MKLSDLHELGEGWLKDKLKKHGPGVAKAIGKAGLKTLEKTGEVAVSTVAGAAKGAYKAAKK